MNTLRASRPQQFREHALDGPSVSLEIYILPSWIGSVNATLVVSVGLVAGRLYDRGYLCVTGRNCCSNVNTDLPEWQLLSRMRGFSSGLLLSIHVIFGPAKSFLSSKLTNYLYAILC